MNKKKKIILASALGVTISILTLGNVVSDKLAKGEDSFINSFSMQNQTLAVYIEDENSETGYSKSDSTQFPTEGYILNIEKSTCTNGGELSQDSSTKKISLSVEHKSSCSLYFDKEIKADSSTTLAKLGKTVKDGTPTFGNAATTNETADGLYAMADDYGTSYYYRGAAEDNYVKFAGFYWRIIRINGDGSLRIIYDGTQAHTNGTNSTNRLALINKKYNANNNDAKYVGYMYGPSGTGASTSKSQAQTNTANSDIKTAIENWYKTNIAGKGHDRYVRDSIYCNDRTTPGKEVTGLSSDTGLGYGGNVTGYGGYARLYHAGTSGFEPSPKFICENKNDAFTKEDTEKGNGKLGEKVGMITADEIVAAGSGKYGTANSNYYLYKGSWYWSLSPLYVYTNGSARVFIVYTSGDLGNNYVNYAGGIAPVISLSAEYVRTMSGNGTTTSPYEVK